MRKMWANKRPAPTVDHEMHVHSKSLAGDSLTRDKQESAHKHSISAEITPVSPKTYTRAVNVTRRLCRELKA